MFGYINVCKEQLLVRDYELFRAYYCGVCRAMGRYSNAVRFSLSYDMVFLAVLLSATSEEDVGIKRKRCFAHPATKRNVAVNSRAIEYAASVGIILSYRKLCDDIKDDKSLKAAAQMPFFYRAYRKAAKKYSKTDEAIRRHLLRLSELEKNRCGEIDEVSDAFAQLLKDTVLDFPVKPDARRQVEWLLYNVGKWIYMIDAYDDVDSDYKHGRYNPFLLEYDETTDFDEYKTRLRERMDMVFALTLQAAAQSYELITVSRCKEILENILYVGLPMKTKKILEETNEPV